MITAICNVYLNSKAKHILFCQSFARVYNISDNWLIYFRGKYSSEAISYIENNFKDFHKNCKIFRDLNNLNWSQSVKEMLVFAKHEYLYFFIEDHFLNTTLDHFKEVIEEVINYKIDHLQYSFFNLGINANSTEILYPDYTKHLVTFELSSQTVELLKKSYPDFFIFSLVCLASKKYFLKILNLESGKLVMVHPRIQWFLCKLGYGFPYHRILFDKINKVLNKIKIRLQRYTPASPLNLEKSIFEFKNEFFPLNLGVLKEELFASYDDDNGIYGSSLMKRGLYPFTLKSPQIVDKEIFPKKYAINRNELIERQYIQNTPRQEAYIVKTIKVFKGAIEVFSNNEKYILNLGELISVYANVKHSIKGIEDSEFGVRLEEISGFEKVDYFSRD